MIACPSCQTEYADTTTRFCGRCGSDMRRAPRGEASVVADPYLGRVVDGRYRIQSKIGQGGMGSVYKVEHLVMGKLAAMKLLHPTLSADPEISRRFRREAEAVSKLSSPHTAQVFDFGIDSGAMYLVMELVRGEDLGMILRSSGPVSFERTRLIVMQACEALAEAHELGIIHRDLKPENLFISRARDGRDLVKVLDFGLAKLRDSEEMTSVTARGALVGTPFYMSPEQIRGEDLDARSDVYSLGALMYRVLTGEHPFSAPTPVAVLTQHLTETLVPPSKRRPDLGLDPIVDVIVGRAMAKKTEDRYPSAEALRQALEGAPHASLPQMVSFATDRADPTGTTPNLKREDVDAWERRLRRRRWIGLATLALVLAVAGAGVALWRWWHRAIPAAVEVEPNDAPKEANLIGTDKTVRGHIGRASAGGSDGRPDRDYFRFVVDRTPQVLRVELTGVPTLDLKVEVFDSNGRELTEGDDAGPAGSETLPNVRLDAPGEYYIQVREVWIDGQPPGVDPDNWYTLRAAWRPLNADEESEPDDGPAQALPVALDVPMRGFLGRTGDVDYYSPRGEGGGTLSGFVTALDGVDVRVVVLPPGATAGPPGSLPKGARVFDFGGPGAPERFEGIRWQQGAGAPIVVVERRDRKEAGQRRLALLGVDTPYSLTVRLNR